MEMKGLSLKIHTRHRSFDASGSASHSVLNQTTDGREVDGEHACMNELYIIIEFKEGVRVLLRFINDGIASLEKLNMEVL
jgi:hypothetical protein